MPPDPTKAAAPATPTKRPVPWFGIVLVTAIALLLGIGTWIDVREHDRCQAEAEALHAEAETLQRKMDMFMGKDGPALTPEERAAKDSFYADLPGYLDRSDKVARKVRLKHYDRSHSWFHDGPIDVRFPLFEWAGTFKDR